MALCSKPDFLRERGVGTTAVIYITQIVGFLTLCYPICQRVQFGKRPFHPTRLPKPQPNPSATSHLLELALQLAVALSFQGMVMPTIFDNKTNKLIDDLAATMDSAQRVDFSVGYFNLRGWRLIDTQIDQLTGGADANCRLLVGMIRHPEEELKLAFGTDTEPPRMTQAQRHFDSLLEQTFCLSRQVHSACCTSPTVSNDRSCAGRGGC